MTTILKALITVVLLFVLCIASAYAAGPYYAISTTGTGGAGTKASPWRVASINWTTLANANNTLYLFGGTWAGLTITHSTSAYTLTIRPCSASTDPTSCDTRVVFTGALNFAEHVVIDGEKTVGACDELALNDINCRWIKMSGTNAQITNNSQKINTFAVKHIEIENVHQSGDNYPITCDDEDCSYFDISYNYIHGCRDSCTINAGSNIQAYNSCQIHHNYLKNDALDYLSMPFGCDVYNNYFDTLDLTGASGYQLYDVVHSWWGGDGSTRTTGNVWERFYNNDFVGCAEQSIFLENQFSTTSDSHKTKHVRIFNNVFNAYWASQPTNQGGIQGVIIKNELGVNGTDDIAIVNNVFANFDASPAIVIRGTASNPFTHFVVENNIFYHNGEDIGMSGAGMSGTPYFADFATAADGILDYNYFATGGTHFGWQGATVGSEKLYKYLKGTTSPTSFVTDHPTYTHNIESNNSSPFISSTDFSLKSDSIAINSGADLSTLSGMPTGWPFDKTGKTISGAWGMGAYQYGNITLTTTPTTTSTIASTTTTTTILSCTDCGWGCGQPPCDPGCGFIRSPTTSTTIPAKASTWQTLKNMMN